MSGEVSVEAGYVFDEVNGEQITLSKLNRQIQDLQLQVAALSITERELADGSVTSDKLATTISAQLGVADGSVTNAKLAAGLIVPVGKGGTGGTTAAGARTGLGVASLAALANKVQAVKTDTQTLTGTAAWTDIADLEVEITPTSAASKVLVTANVCCSDSASGGLVFFRILRDGSPIGVGDLVGSRDQAGFMTSVAETSEVDSASQCFLDSPGTTSVVTYKLQMRMINATYSCFINKAYNDVDTSAFARFVSSLLCEEVPQ